MEITPTKEELQVSHEIVRALNRCIEACTDGEKCYGVAAADVRAPELKALFHKYAQERDGFVIALQDAIRKLGAMPENEGTIRGSLHRTWMTTRRVFGGRDDHTILQECVYGEEAALRAYEAADRIVHHAVPEEIRTLVQQQYAAIKKADAEVHARLAS